MSVGVSAGARWAWGITGSGHFLRESLDLVKEIPDTDFFLSSAAAEVLKMYDFSLAQVGGDHHVYRDTTASAAPVGQLYRGRYHTIVLAPASSNTVAKCALGIADTLVSNIFAQAGKCRIPAIIFACDSEPVVITEAPGKWVTLYPRPIDLHHTAQLATFPLVQVAHTVAQLRNLVHQRLAELRQ